MLENYKKDTKASSSCDAVMSCITFSCHDYALRILGCISSNNKKPLKDPLDITHHGENFIDEKLKSNFINSQPIDISDITSLPAKKTTSWQSVFDNTMISKTFIKAEKDPLDIKNYSPRSLIKVANYK